MHRRAVYYFASLLLLAIAGFWPTYLVPKFERDWHVHLHGVAMFAWVLLLLAQSWLIRAKRFSPHRALGRVSYGLAPVIVASTLLLAHHRMKQGISTELLYFFYVQLALLVMFVVAYALAIANRHTPVIHARYMVCVALTLIDPIMARLLSVYLGTDFPALQVVTYAFVDAILLALIASDQRQRHKPQVYPGMLALFAATQLPTFFIYRLSAWRDFVAWYAGLPLP